MFIIRLSELEPVKCIQYHIFQEGVDRWKVIAKNFVIPIS